VHRAWIIENLNEPPQTYKSWLAVLPYSECGSISLYGVYLLLLYILYIHNIRCFYVGRRVDKQMTQLTAVEIAICTILAYNAPCTYYIIYIYIYICLYTQRIMYILLYNIVFRRKGEHINACVWRAPKVDSLKAGLNNSGLFKTQFKRISATVRAAQDMAPPRVR